MNFVNSTSLNHPQWPLVSPSPVYCPTRRGHMHHPPLLSVALRLKLIVLRSKARTKNKIESRYLNIWIWKRESECCKKEIKFKNIFSLKYYRLYTKIFESLLYYLLYFQNLFYRLIDGRLLPGIYFVLKRKCNSCQYILN